jgi:hypothetical protein
MSRAGAPAPDAASASMAGRPRPRTDNDPAWRKSRRVRPSQKWTGLLASTRIIVQPRIKVGRSGRAGTSLSGLY